MVIRRPTIMTLIIHHLQASQSERIVWLAEELGLDYQLVIHKRDPFLSPQSIKDLNPLGQAPGMSCSFPCLGFVLIPPFASRHPTPCRD
jgi:hypothetical protein